MRVEDIFAKEVHVTIEHSMTELRLLKEILDNMTFNCDPNNPVHLQADQYLHDVLYPVVKDLVEQHGPKTD